MATNIQVKTKLGSYIQVIWQNFVNSNNFDVIS